MKVLDLRCAHEHRFEGWFASEAAFEAQRSTQLVACPICGDTHVERMPSAPRLNLSGARAPRGEAAESAGARETVPAPAGADGSAAAKLRDGQQKWLQAVREVMRNTEDVGSRFAEEARRIHYRETPERAIRGVASREEAQSLAEEGIDVVALPVPAALKQTLQ